MHWLRSALVLISSLWFAAPLAAQNPWAVVPAFPTTCYTEGDPFPNQIDAAESANTDAGVRQEQINQELDDQADALDDAVTQSRMIAYQKKNPTGIQKYMQFMDQGNQAVHTASENHRLRKSQFQKEFDTLLANYEAALKTTLDPVNARRLKVTDSLSRASSAEVAAVLAEYNSTYKAHCEKWIIGGKFPAFLTKFKAYLVGTYLPSMEIQAAMDKAELEMKGISTKDYQDTEPFDAAGQYIDYVQTVYGLRWRQPQGF